MNDQFERYKASIDTQKMSLTLTKDADKSWKASFAFTRPAADRLILDGTMDGHKLQMELRREDEKKFLLSSRGFHWIQEYPYIR